MKNISVGNWVTIFIVLGNFIWMIGIMSKDVLNAQETASTALEMAYDNDKQIAVMVVTMEQGFSNIEKLIIKTNGD